MTTLAGPPRTLRKLQQQVAERILRPERLEDEHQRLPIAAPPRGSLAERIGVYVNGYPARVEEALEETFPALAHLIGPGAFASLTRRYIGAVVPPTYNLNDVGAELADYLCVDELAVQLPFLPDLARLEWQLSIAFHAYDGVPLDARALRAWSEDDWDRAVLRFQPSVGYIASDWPLPALWKARETPVTEIDLDLRDRPDRVLVYRAGLTVQCESVGVAEGTALAALLNGHTLGEVTEHLASRGHAPEVADCFARWMRLGIIRGCGRIWRSMQPHSHTQRDLKPRRNEEHEDKSEV